MDTAALQQARDFLAAKDYAQLVGATLDWQNEATGEGAKLHALGLLGAGRPQEALLVFPTAARQLPNDGVVAFAYGQANLQVGQLEAAKECFEQLLRLIPTHPSVKKSIEDVSLKLAARDEQSNPMQAITWLYRAWELAPQDAGLSFRILNLYNQNGWQDAAKQFAAQLSPTVMQNAKIQGLMGSMASGGAAPVAAPAAGSQNPHFEACPFCKQQVMSGIANCPHCKMQIRASVFQDVKPIREWQAVTLNVLLGIGLVLNVISIIATLASGGQGTKSGGWSLLTSSISVMMNVLVLMRVEWAMTVSKYWYLMVCVTLGFCGCASLGLVSMMGSTGVGAIVILFVSSALNGFLSYLVHYEDQ